MENINLTTEEVIMKLREKLSQEQYNYMILELTAMKLQESIKVKDEEIKRQEKIIENYESQKKPNQ